MKSLNTRFDILSLPQIRSWSRRPRPRRRFGGTERRWELIHAILQSIKLLLHARNINMMHRIHLIKQNRVLRVHLREAVVKLGQLLSDDVHI